MFALMALVLASCGGDEAACPEASPSTREACVTACEGGDAEACARLGVAYESGALGETGADAVSAARYFGQACAHAPEGQQWLCVLGATVSDDGRPATDELERLCAAGVVLACHELVRSERVADAVPIDLPGVEPEQPTASVTVTIAADGALLLDGAPTRLQAIREMQRPAGTRAVIAADAQVPHARVVEVIDALRQAGIASQSFAVRPEDEPPPPAE